MKGFLRVLRSAVAVVAGYAVMVVLITLVQEVAFGGVSYHGSPTGELVAAGLLTVLCAVAGGFTAAWIAGASPLLHASIMSVFVLAESTTLYLTGRVGGPLWFDVLAAASLIAGLLAGALLFAWVQTARRPRAAPKG